jgi:hypothetical protein
MRLTSSACGRTPGKLQVARVRLLLLGSNACYGEYKELTLENLLEEDNIFESLRAIGANFDRDRSAFTVQPVWAGLLAFKLASRTR